MAFRITYARLLECRFWHGYYLHQGNRQNFYELDPAVPAEAATRTTILSAYDVRNIFSIQPLSATQRLLAGHRIKLATDASGFFLGTAVRSVEGTLWVEPRIPLDEGTTLYFGVEVENSGLLAQVTNERMATNVPAIYYFSNFADEYADANLTTLAQPYPNYEARRYEMGELVTDGSQLFRARQGDSNGAGLGDTDYWEVLSNDHFELTDNDRSLLPKTFNYRLTPRTAQTINTATITLVDDNGDTVFTEDISLGAGQDSIRLDFKEQADGWYQLNVTTDTDYATTKRVLLNEELYKPDRWGVLAFGHRNGLPSPLRLLEADGSLRHNAANTGTEPPTFNIRFPNRHCYWRYTPHPRQPLNPIATTSVSAVADGHLVTKTQLPLTHYGVRVNYQDSSSGSVVSLPNPSVHLCRPDMDERFYADVNLGILPLTT